MPEIGWYVAFLLELLVVVSGGVWVVATIRGSVSGLAASVDHLRDSTDRLEKAIRELDQKIDNHEHRLTVMEVHHAKNHGSSGNLLSRVERGLQDDHDDGA